jgi:hypothetical protein
MVASSAPEKFTSLFFKNGLLDCKKSTLTEKKPIAFISFKNQLKDTQQQEYILKTMWYQEKIEIKDLSIIDIKSNN